METAMMVVARKKNNGNYATVVHFVTKKNKDENVKACLD